MQLAYNEKLSCFFLNKFFCGVAMNFSFADMLEKR